LGHRPGGDGGDPQRRRRLPAHPLSGRAHRTPVAARAGFSSRAGARSARRPVRKDSHMTAPPLAPAPQTARTAPEGDAVTRSRRAARLRTALTRPTTLLAGGVLVILAILVISPLLGLLNTTLAAGNRGAWMDVFASPMSENLLWRPLGNSLLMGTATAWLSTLIGGFLAWVVVMTRLPGRGVLGVLAT